MACKGLTKKGEPCKRPPGKDKEYCWNHSQNRDLDAEYYKEGTSHKYKVGHYLVPLTIDHIRRRFWNPKTKQFCKIEYFSPQSSADRLRIEKVEEEIGIRPKNFRLHVREEYDDPKTQAEYEREFPDQMKHILYSGSTFKPNGDLLVGCDSQKTRKKWLQSNEPGPYAEGERSPFYYLKGDLTNSDADSDPQVCAGPLNVVSHDCLDAINFWVVA